MNGINYNEINFNRLENQQIGVKGAKVDEKNEYKNGLTKEECEALDTNKDGFLTEEEFKAAFEDLNSKETYWNAYSSFCGLKEGSSSQTVGGETVTTKLNDRNQITEIKTATHTEKREYNEQGVLIKTTIINKDNSYGETVYDTSTGRPIGTLYYSKDKELTGKEIYEYNKYNLKEVIVKKVNIKTDKIEQEIRYYDGEIRQINTYDNEGKCQNKLIYAYNQNDDGTKSVRIKIHGENISAGIQGVITSEIDKDGNSKGYKGDITPEFEKAIKDNTKFPTALKNKEIVIEGNKIQANTAKAIEEAFSEETLTDIKTDANNAYGIINTYVNILKSTDTNQNIKDMVSWLFDSVIQPQLYQIYSNMQHSITKNAIQGEIKAYITAEQKDLIDQYNNIRNQIIKLVELNGNANLSQAKKIEDQLIILNEISPQETSQEQ